MEHGGSLVDPSFELLDPTPNIHELFMQFDARFFGGALACCEVKWSPRMYSCAGICSYEIRGGRGGLCSIRLSKPLLSLRPRKDLVETLLHEMIHAFLFVKERNRDRDGHGPHFQSHMHRINAQSGTNITIYHSFHNEVRLYKNHWWRCSGPCRERRPFFGYVKRSSNRAPGANDRWWSQHQMSCGGKFEKVKEPEGYGQKKSSSSKKLGNEPKKPVAPKKTVTPPRRTLDDYLKKPGALFTGSGQKLGGSGCSSGSSKLLEKFPEPSGCSSGSLGLKKYQDGSSDRSGAQIGSSGSKKWAEPSGSSSGSLELKKYQDASSGCSSEPTKKWAEPEVIVLGDSDDEEAESSFFLNPTTVICPSCNLEVAELHIHAHLDECLA